MVGAFWNAAPPVSKVEAKGVLALGGPFRRRGWTQPEKLVRVDPRTGDPFRADVGYLGPAPTWSLHATAAAVVGAVTAVVVVVVLVVVVCRRSSSVIADAVAVVAGR